LNIPSYKVEFKRNSYFINYFIYFLHAISIHAQEQIFELVYTHLLYFSSLYMYLDFNDCFINYNLNFFLKYFYIILMIIFLENKNFLESFYLK
jgi:hypothetical protein